MLESKEKVALFDFCETIADFQTADAFVDFVREKMNKRRMHQLEAVQKCLRKLQVIRIAERLYAGHSINKRIKLYQLKGLAISDLDYHAKEYYEQRIKPHFIKPMIKKLEELKKEGYSVGLVSGGYSIYLRYFVEDYNLSFCIASEIEIENGVCTGKLKGQDCLNMNKIERLNSFFRKRPLETIAFSDSQSDTPLLQWASEGVVISRNKHQEWINKYNFKEIIWQQ